MKNIILFISLIANVLVCFSQQEKRFRYPETVELQAAEYVAPPIYDYEFLDTAFIFELNLGTVKYEYKLARI